MDKKSRKKKFIELLITRPEGMTGEDIATQIGVSSRTVRSDMKKLQERLQSFKSEIIAAPNKGYRLEVKEPREVLLQLSDESKTQVGMLQSVSQQNYIIGRFIVACLDDDSVTQMHLSEEMHVGISTIKKYLAETWLKLEEWNLTLEQYKTEGLRIAGEEGNIRSFIVDYLQEVENPLVKERIFSQTSDVQYQDILLNISEVRNLPFTDTAQHNLIVQVALSVLRSQRGHTLAITSSLAQKLEVSFEHDTAKKIANSINEKLSIDLPFSEVFYLTQCLLTGKKFHDGESGLNDDHIRQLVETILDRVDEKFGLDFSDDSYLKEGLMLHLRIAIARVQFHMAIRNELLETVKHDYPVPFQISVYAAKIVSDIEGVQFNENEIGYIALHFGAAMSRNSMMDLDEVKRVYIVCSAGLGVSMLLKAKVREHFRNSIQVVDVLPAYKVTQDIIDDADFIFSTVPLPMESPKILSVNHMLQKEDIEKIQRVVFHRQDEVGSDDLMKGFFHGDSFFLNKDFKTREECLEFLTDQAVQGGYMDEQSKQSVFEREQLSSTAVGNLAALPHAMDTEHVKSNISVLTLQKPIPWGDMQVQIVFLLTIEQEKSALWEKVFLRLYNFIKDGNGAEQMRKIRDFEQFMSLFAEVIP